MIIVVMGVTSSGKSTIGKLLAKRLSLPFIEGDEFHPEENIIKMGRGIPLNDEDRIPWLQTLSHELQLHEKNKGAVLACSALKESYRKNTSARTERKNYLGLSGWKPRAHQKKDGEEKKSFHAGSASPISILNLRKAFLCSLLFDRKKAGGHCRRNCKQNK